MGIYNQIIDNAEISTSTLDEQATSNQEEQTVEPVASEKTTNNEVNETDPKVCHDPLFQSEGIARLYTNEGKIMMQDGEFSDFNADNQVKTDGIQYPLLVINDRNIEALYIIDYKLNYDEFLPTIEVTVRDDHQEEQRINSTQMSGIIRTAIVPSVDKVYKKVLMQFRIIDVSINHNNPTIVTYYGQYEIPNFRDVHTKHIWMKDFCPAKWCQWPPEEKIAANTWEFLHELSRMAGLGFQATKFTKEINDRIIRNIPTQRIGEYIANQIAYSGVDNESIMDAWVDLYGYIVLINVSYVFNKEMKPEELTIIANYGLNSTTDFVPGQEPQPVERTLTNFPYMSTISNMMIRSYSMEIDNSAVSNGTLQQNYMIQLVGRDTIMNRTDIQIRQDSLDGNYLEDYNTGKSNPIPKFNFNHPSYTGLQGYDLNLQENIRNAWFKKKRQSILKVELSQVNLGLQRGTLINIAIFDNDTVNKKKYNEQASNVGGDENTLKEDNVRITNDWSSGSVLIHDSVWEMNLKLSGLYYIDKMQFIYNHQYDEIVQILYLIKKGVTTGYDNRHTYRRVPDIEGRATEQQDPYSAEDAQIYTT